MAFSSDDFEINRHQNSVISPSDSGKLVFNKKSKKINENNSIAEKKSLMNNLTPSDESNKKKKRFSIQKFSQIEEKTNLTLADLPLVPLSYICTNLNVAERDKFSQVCIKFALANRMSWFRRSRLNIRSDIASYILRYDDIDDMYDDSFDFISTDLLVDKVHLICSYFDVPRLFSVDFSLPKNSSEANKWGDILTMLTRESFRISMKNVRQNIVDMNLCDVLVTKEVLKECSQMFPYLLSISLSMHTLIWRRSTVSNANFDVVNAKTVQNWDQNNKRILPNVVELLSFLYIRFPRLKYVNLLD